MDPAALRSLSPIIGTCLFLGLQFLFRIGFLLLGLELHYRGLSAFSKSLGLSLEPDPIEVGGGLPFKATAMTWDDFYKRNIESLVGPASGSYIHIGIVSDSVSLSFRRTTSEVQPPAFPQPFLLMKGLPPLTRIQRLVHDVRPRVVSYPILLLPPRLGCSSRKSKNLASVEPCAYNRIIPMILKYLQRNSRLQRHKHTKLHPNPHLSSSSANSSQSAVYGQVSWAPFWPCHRHPRVPTAMRRKVPRDEPLVRLPGKHCVVSETWERWSCQILHFDIIRLTGSSMQLHVFGEPYPHLLSNNLVNILPRRTL